MAIHAYTTQAGRINQVKGEILAHAIPREVLNITGNQHKMDQNTGDTIIFRRYLPNGATTTNSTTINTITATPNTHQIQEGVTPQAETIIPQDITVTLDYYGCLYSYTRKTAEMYEDKIPMHMKKICGERVGLLREMISYGALKGITNAFYAGGTTRGTVDETIKLNLIRNAVRSLEGNRANPVTTVIRPSRDYNSAPVTPGYIVFCHTDMAASIRDLPGFIERKEYAKEDALHPRELGSCEEFRFVTSPELGSYADSGAAIGSTGLTSTTGTSIDVYPVIVVADDAWGNVALRGKESFEVKHLPYDKIDSSDPLGQRGFLGAIFPCAAFIQNDGWAALLECGALSL
jgi:N4-gp56 family major capsid protein